MKLREMRQGAPSADDLAAAFRAARGEFMKRREQYLEKGSEQLDKRVKELERSAKSTSWQARRDLANRLHPQRGRSRLMMLLFGLALGVGLGYAAADRRNRERLAEYARSLADRARPVVENAGARLGVGEPLRAAEETALLTAAQGVLATPSEAEGLRVAVEGRTIYLRGQAPAEVAQEVAERLRVLPGAAAVVNLSMASPAGTTEQTVERANSAPAGAHQHGA